MQSRNDDPNTVAYTTLGILGSFALYMFCCAFTERKAILILLECGVALSIALLALIAVIQPAAPLEAIGITPDQ